MKVSQTMQAIQGLQKMKRSKETPKTKVLFLYNEANEDLFAFFPELKEKENTFLAYSHIGQHSECHIEYAKESKEVTELQYMDLYNELTNSGYNLQLTNKSVLETL